MHCAIPYSCYLIMSVIYTGCSYCLSIDINLYIGPEDYPIIRDVNIPIGTGPGDSVCTDITLTADTRVEEEQETFSIRLMAPDDASRVFVLPSDTTATVTIIDADSKRNLTLL